MTKYAAFLRGINVGGYKLIPMEKLKKAFESLRFKNVRTLLSSGNVVFEAQSTNIVSLEQTIEKKISEAFKQGISVLVRSREELQRLSESQPFKGIEVTPQTRLYVTFLPERTKRSMKIPYASPDMNLRILHASTHEVCSVLTLTPTGRTVDLMTILEKEFGQRITTRNWNTIVRILKIQQS